MGRRRASLVGFGVRVAILAGGISIGHGLGDPPRGSAESRDASESSGKTERASKKGEPTEFGPVPAGSLRAKRGVIELAIYLPKGSAEALLKSARKTARKQTPRLRVADGFDAEAPRPALWLFAPLIEEYAPPSEESLAYFGRGLSEAQVRDTANAKVAIVLALGADIDDLDGAHRDLLRLAHSLAVKWNGVVWDEETREVYSPAAWKEQRLGWTEGYPDVSRHMTMHAYRDGVLVRMVTLGMGKFGLPDLVVNQVAREWSRPMNSLINLAAQTLVEKPRIEKAGKLPVSLDAIANASARKAQTTGLGDNAARKAVLLVETTPPQEGDAANRLLEIVFSEVSGETEQVGQSRTLSRVYGSVDDVVQVADDNAELEAASKRALAELMKLKPRFDELDSLDSLLVKAPFRTSDGGTEWMWVEVTSWKGKLLSGILSSDPADVPELEAGAKVEVEEDTVFDYIHRRADGTQAGNETGKIIQRIQEERGR